MDRRRRAGGGDAYRDQGSEALPVRAGSSSSLETLHPARRGRLNDRRPAGFAAELVNTEETGGDEIEDLERLEEYLTRFEQLRPPGIAPATEADLLAIRRTRDALRQVFNAEDESTATELLDSILDEHPALARVATHGHDPHLHYEPLESTVASWVGATTAMGLAGVVVEHGISRFGSCAASNCRDVFVDTTRNRSRIHCCQTCSTREAVAAYRRRNQGG